jgi:hypothetical protein
MNRRPARVAAQPVVGLSVVRIAGRAVIMSAATIVPANDTTLMP